jgi:hypothetical protein
MHHEVTDRDDVRVAQPHDLHGDGAVLHEKITAFRRVLQGRDGFENGEILKLLIAGRYPRASPREYSCSSII